MNALLFLAITLAVAEDDIYSPFKRSCVIQNRINSVTAETKNLQMRIEIDEQQERNFMDTLFYLYRDLKYATLTEDRTRLELEIEGIQKKLHDVRTHKVDLLRDIRKSADKVTQPFRDNIARTNRIERHVGLEDSGNFVEERYKTQDSIKKITEALANKYASLAAKVEAQNVVEKATKKFKNDAKKIKEYVEKKAEAAYKDIHAKVVKAINGATENGVVRSDVEAVAKTAIEGLVNTLEMKAAALPNIKVAEKLADKIVKTQLKGVKKTTKKVAKKATKKATKKVTKKPAPKKK
uniref:Uncharacterized protein n=1 Tax=Entamoeba invadens TaxID=33085 RepID=S0AZ33_ENTIV|nr:hypothetical protein, conserved [Entamoeba invadens]